MAIKLNWLFLQSGQIEIINHRTNYRAVIRFRAAGSDLHDLHKVDGYILDEKCD